MTSPHMPCDAVNVLATPERFNGELAWHIAHTFFATQLERGLLTEAEMGVIDRRLRQSFKPVYDAAKPAV